MYGLDVFGVADGVPTPARAGGQFGACFKEGGCGMEDGSIDAGAPGGVGRDGGDVKAVGFDVGGDSSLLGGGRCRNRGYGGGLGNLRVEGGRGFSSNLKVGHEFERTAMSMGLLARRHLMGLGG